MMNRSSERVSKIDWEKSRSSIRFWIFLDFFLFFVGADRGGGRGKHTKKWLSLSFIVLRMSSHLTSLSGRGVGD